MGLNLDERDPPPATPRPVAAADTTGRTPTTTTTTTTIIVVATVFAIAAAAAQPVDADRGLLRDLGLDALPDVTKVNISLEEYTSMMGLYLSQLKDSTDGTASIPKLYTFNSERKTWRRWSDDDGGVAIRLAFPIRPSAGPSGEVEVESAEMKLLVPPQAARRSVRVRAYQVVGVRRRRFLGEKVVYVSQALNKWCELDVTDVVRNWVAGDRNLGIELQCPDCAGGLEPLRASINALVKVGGGRVRRASAGAGGKKHVTDCVGSRKRKCCRHEMHVTFKDLELTQMETIVQPKSYEAGFCRGRCPVNFNHATNHSRIQSLVHRRNKTAMPKVCCAPSKLEPLEIIRIDPANTQKLMIEKWDNMKVVECACS